MRAALRDSITRAAVTHNIDRHTELIRQPQNRVYGYL